MYTVNTSCDADLHELWLGPTRAWAPHTSLVRLTVPATPAHPAVAPPATATPRHSAGGTSGEPTPATAQHGVAVSEGTDSSSRAPSQPGVCAGGTRQRRATGDPDEKVLDAEEEEQENAPLNDNSTAWLLASAEALRSGQLMFGGAEGQGSLPLRPRADRGEGRRALVRRNLPPSSREKPGQGCQLLAAGF